MKTDLIIAILWLACSIHAILWIKPWKPQKPRGYVYLGDVVFGCFLCIVAGPIMTLFRLGSIRLN